MNQGPNSTQPESVRMSELIIETLEDIKGVDIQRLDVTSLTDVTNVMIITTGTSNRHIMALADKVVETMRQAGWCCYGVEGKEDRQWVLLDFIDVVVHVMCDSCRKHYDLESLWDKNLSKISTSP